MNRGEVREQEDSASDGFHSAESGTGEQRQATAGSPPQGATGPEDTHAGGSAVGASDAPNFDLSRADIQ
ncbi:unnamed protein product [Phytophthora fragariaefolia]|uniref:Unnamed protein product n=1 Tax=Phytophthora fragariaefolia TaxID=1490495 RepID=A0A9W6U9A0_9STRA|nr:unnamed protein product [Phytophthora fragariaefolia]